MRIVTSVFFLILLSASCGFAEARAQDGQPISEIDPSALVGTWEYRVPYSEVTSTLTTGTIYLNVDESAIAGQLVDDQHGTFRIYDARVRDSELRLRIEKRSTTRPQRYRITANIFHDELEGFLYFADPAIARVRSPFAAKRVSQ